MGDDQSQLPNLDSVSQAILQGRKQDAGSIARVAAPEVEGKVLEAVRAALGDAERAEADIRMGIEQVTIGRAGLLIRRRAVSLAI